MSPDFAPNSRHSRYGNSSVITKEKEDKILRENKAFLFFTKSTLEFFFVVMGCTLCQSIWTGI